MSSFIIFCYMNGNRCITRTRILKYGLKYQAPGTGLRFPAHLIRCAVRALSTLARPAQCLRFQPDFALGCHPRQQRSSASKPTAASIKILTPLGSLCARAGASLCLLFAVQDGSGDSLIICAKNSICVGDSRGRERGL